MSRFPFLAIPEWVYEPFHPWTLFHVLLATAGSLLMAVLFGGV